MKKLPKLKYSFIERVKKKANLYNFALGNKDGEENHPWFICLNGILFNQ